VTQNEAVLAEVMSLELRLLDPATRASAAAVERLIHPDLREIGASGRTWDRASMTRALAARPGDAADATDLTARLVSDDVVLVTYTARQDDGRTLRRSSLWVHGDEGWRVFFHQGTPIGCTDLENPGGAAL
jgi:hypothetical protein